MHAHLHFSAPVTAAAATLLAAAGKAKTLFGIVFGAAVGGR